MQEEESEAPFDHMITERDTRHVCSLAADCHSHFIIIVTTVIHAVIMKQSGDNRRRKCRHEASHTGSSCRISAMLGAASRSQWEARMRACDPLSLLLLLCLRCLCL